MAYYLGLDCGGTKTECWLADESTVLAQATAGTCKLMRVGEAVATERMTALLDEAARRSGVALSSVAGTSVGIAGYSIAAVRAWVERVVGGHVGGALSVCGDETIALDAAFAGGPGILVIAGTGSAVVARAADGTRVTAGGWGPAVGDEGSGFWIGREAVGAALQALDRGAGGALLAAILQGWGVADIGALVELANARPGPDFAALVPAVLAAAESGDRNAAAVLARAGRELAAQINTAWERLRAQGRDATKVACTGSILTRVAPVREAFTGALPAGLQLLPGTVDPPAGAIWQARRLAG